MVFTNHPLKLLCQECSPYVNLSLSACDNRLKQTGVRFIVMVQSCKWALKNFRISWSWQIQGWGMLISKRFREQTSCWKHHWQFNLSPKISQFLFLSVLLSVMLSLETQMDRVGIWLLHTGEQLLVLCSGCLLWMLWTLLDQLVLYLET